MRYQAKENIKRSKANQILTIIPLAYVSIGYLLSSIAALKDSIVPYEANQSHALARVSVLNWSYPLVTAVSTLIFSCFISKFKRRFSFLVSDVIILVSSILVYYSEQYKFIVLGRLIAALGSAINLVLIPKMIKETYLCVGDEGVQGRTQITLAYLHLSCGIGLGMILPRIFDPLSIGHSIPALIATARIVLSYSLIDESPLYFVQNEQDQEAMSTLKDLGVQDTAAALQHYKNYLRGLKTEKTLGKMLEYKFRSRTLAGMMLVAIQSMSGFSFILFYINSFFLYYDSLLSKGNSSLTESDLVKQNMTLFGILFLAAQLGSAFILYRYNPARKQFFLWGICGCAFCAFGIAVTTLCTAFEYARVLVYVYFIVWAFGYGNVVEVYINEILPEKGLLLVEICRWIAITVCGAFLQWVYDFMFQVGGVFLLVFCFNVMSIWLILELLPETKGVEPRKIDRLFVNADQMEEMKGLEEASQLSLQTDEDSTPTASRVTTAKRLVKEESM